MKTTTWFQPNPSRHLGALVGGVILSLFLIWLFVSWGAQASAQFPARRGSLSPPRKSSQETIEIEFFYPGDDPTSASTAAVEFADLLSQETGLDIHAAIQSCEANIVEHFGAGQVDLSPLSPVAYVLGHDAYGVEARLVNGKFGAYAYRSQINVQAISGYTDIWDLQDTRFVFPSPDSVSGYMAPYLLILDSTGMTPSAFFGEVDFVGSHPQVIRDVYTGTADGGATYEDARASVEGEYPDVYDVVSVLTYSEYVPNDPWAFRQGLDGMVVQTLTNGIIAVAGMPDGENALETIFGYDLTGIGATQDSAYDITRDLVATFGLQLEVCHNIYLPIVLKNVGR
jgi:phosphonate transport system substrate-binding protein